MCPVAGPAESYLEDRSRAIVRDARRMLWESSSACVVHVEVRVGAHLSRLNMRACAGAESERWKSHAMSANILAQLCRKQRDMCTSPAEQSYPAAPPCNGGQLLGSHRQQHAKCALFPPSNPVLPHPRPCMFWSGCGSHSQQPGRHMSRRDPSRRDVPVD